MPTNQDKIFTATDVMALQEDMHKSIKVIGEQHGTIIKRLDSIDAKIACIPDMQHDIAMIKIDLRDKKADKKEVQMVSARVTVLENHFVPA